MTTEQLEQYKKSHVMQWQYAEAQAGRTPTDAQIRNKYLEIPEEGFPEWTVADNLKQRIDTIIN